MSASVTTLERRSGWRKTLFVLVLAIALALETLAASCTVLLLHDHDCTGEDCVACHVTGMAKTLLNAQAAPAATMSVVRAALALCCLGALAWWLDRAAETPVSLGDLLLI